MSISRDYQRTNRLLRRKFSSYLLPTTLTMAALSLNEFVDSMMVSQLLGPESMAVVNLGMPVMLMMACIYALLGNGGATLFARLLGEKSRETAGACFRTAMLGSAVSGILLMLGGMTFFDPLSRLLCHDPNLLAPFSSYLKVAVLSAPLIIILLAFLEFLPSCGVPAYATAINVLANGVNLVMDVVYIRFFHLGVEGAAYATLTGYAVGMIPVLWILAARKIQIPKGRLFDLHLLKGITATGGSTALVQLGFTMKFGVSNIFAARLGGTAGVVAFSLCIQSISFAAIFQMGATGAATPLIAVLHGQRDYYGEHVVLKDTIRVTELFLISAAVLFFLFPGGFAAIYHITEPEELSLSIHALRIFVIAFAFRGFDMVMMKYLQAIGDNAFSIFISLFDGCIGIIPFILLFTKLIGLDGVWAAYPVTAVVLLGIIIAHNFLAIKQSNGQLTGLLMFRKEEPTVRMRSWTIPQEQPAWLSEALSDFCAESGLPGRISMHVGLVAEEMVLYTREHAKKADYMDVIARQYGDRVEIDFRSLGDPVNPLLFFESDAPDTLENGKEISLRILREMTDDLDYEYVMGMNCTYARIGIR